MQIILLFLSLLLAPVFSDKDVNACVNGSINFTFSLYDIFNNGVCWDGPDKNCFQDLGDLFQGLYLIQVSCDAVDPEEFAHSLIDNHFNPEGQICLNGLLGDAQDLWLNWNKF